MPRRPVSTRGSVADLTGTFRFGIEEEYFLVDAETKAIAPTVPEALFAAAKSSTLGRGKGEFLQQQLEVATGTLLMAAAQAFSDAYIRLRAASGRSLDTADLATLHKALMENIRKIGRARYSVKQSCYEHVGHCNEASYLAVLSHFRYQWHDSIHLAALDTTGAIFTMRLKCLLRIGPRTQRSGATSQTRCDRLVRTRPQISWREQVQQTGEN